MPNFNTVSPQVLPNASRPSGITYALFQMFHSSASLCLGMALGGHVESYDCRVTLNETCEVGRVS
jgi:hypothetical protein